MQLFVFQFNNISIANRTLMEQTWNLNALIDLLLVYTRAELGCSVIIFNYFFELHTS